MQMRQMSVFFLLQNIQNKYCNIKKYYWIDFFSQRKLFVLIMKLNCANNLPVLWGITYYVQYYFRIYWVDTDISRYIRNCHGLSTNTDGFFGSVHCAKSFFYSELLPNMEGCTAEYIQ
jgi:hypothetical protein